MRKVYYKAMRNAALPILVLLSSAALSHSQQPNAPMKASVLDAHEGMTIGAEPWTSAAQYKQSFPKKSPYDAGIIAIHVYFRNDTNDSIRVGLDRIRLTLNMDENNRQELRPMSSDDLADAILRPGGKDPTPSRARLPLPIPTGKSGGRDKKWEELKKTAEEAGVHNGVVAPHTTSQGLLYFDMRGQFELLNGAHLYIPDLVALEANRALLYFDLELGSGSNP